VVVQNLGDGKEEVTLLLIVEAVLAAQTVFLRNPGEVKVPRISGHRQPG
jgi:hypothetical protein